MNMDYEPRTPAWMLSASCASVGEPDMFYPTSGSAPKAAIKVCRACPVQVECLEHALATREAFGVWGGLTEQARRRLNRNTDPTGAAA